MRQLCKRAAVSGTQCGHDLLLLVPFGVAMRGGKERVLMAQTFVFPGVIAFDLLEITPGRGRLPLKKERFACERAVPCCRGGVVQLPCAFGNRQGTKEVRNAAGACAYQIGAR